MRNGSPFAKSFDTKNTGRRHYLSLSIGLVTPSSMHSGAENVNVPNFGIVTPLPILICRDIYRPKLDHTSDRIESLVFILL